MSNALLLSEKVLSSSGLLLFMPPSKHLRLESDIRLIVYLKLSLMYSMILSRVNIKIEIYKMHQAIL